jgi:hypothetical protein
VLALIAALAVAWALAPGSFQSSATAHSRTSQPAPVAAVALEPAAANPPMRKIVGVPQYLPEPRIWDPKKICCDGNWSEEFVGRSKH